MATITANAVLISPCASDHEFLQILFLKNGWSFRSATSFEAARKLVRRAPVVLTEADLHPRTWRDVLVLAGALPNPPLVIVFSIHADEYLWAEALNLGAHDVIAKPFDKLEVTRVLSAAWTARGRPPATPVNKKGMGGSARQSIAFGGNHGYRQGNS